MFFVTEEGMRKCAIESFGRRNRDIVYRLSGRRRDGGKLIGDFSLVGKMVRIERSNMQEEAGIKSGCQELLTLGTLEPTESIKYECWAGNITASNTIFVWKLRSRFDSGDCAHEFGFLFRFFKHLCWRELFAESGFQESYEGLSWLMCLLDTFIINVHN